MTANRGDVQKVAVVGAGTMGAEIAALAALGGFETALFDIAPEQLERAARKLQRLLPEMEAKGKIGAGTAGAALGRLQYRSDLPAAVTAADYVVEAVHEDLDLKRRVFADLDRLAPAHAVLATNSSTIVSSRIADATGRPDQVINLHFFTPPLLQSVVEVVQGPHVSDETASITMAVAGQMGLKPVLLKKETFGFVVNRVLGAVLSEALRIVEDGVATPEEVDYLVTRTIGHQLGPFRILDLVGNDVAWFVGKEKERATGRPEDGPSRLLTQKVERGELGRKSGKGWYTYR